MDNINELALRLEAGRHQFEKMEKREDHIPDQLHVRWEDYIITKDKKAEHDTLCYQVRVGGISIPDESFTDVVLGKWLPLLDQRMEHYGIADDETISDYEYQYFTAPNGDVWTEVIYTVGEPNYHILATCLILLSEIPHIANKLEADQA